MGHRLIEKDGQIQRVHLPDLDCMMLLVCDDVALHQEIGCKVSARPIRNPLLLSRKTNVCHWRSGMRLLKDSHCLF